MTTPPLHMDCPALIHLPVFIREEVIGQAHNLSIPANTQLFDHGHACNAMPLVLSGSIRVFKRSEGGREISLYRVNKDELCIITISCLLGGNSYPATGVTETDVTALALPRALFLRLIETQPGFRETAFHLFAERMTGLMQLVEEITFHKLDQRLANLLVTKTPLLESSHQQLADELGSVREIISRLLKQFEEHGWIGLSRKRIEIIDPGALKEYANNPR